MTNKKATSFYIFLLKFAETSDTLLKSINSKRKKRIFNPM